MEMGAKRAVQQRSRLTRDKIMRAMDEMLAVQSFEGISIATLSAKAGVSAASIYQRFENKDALISILIALYLEKVRDYNQLPENQPDIKNANSFHEVLMLIGMAAWAQFDELSYIMRPAYLYSRLRPELMGGHWQAQERVALQGFESMLSRWPHEVGGGELKPVAAMVAYFYNMMFLGRLLHNEEDNAWQLSLNAEDFAKQLADFVVGYLGRVHD